MKFSSFFFMPERPRNYLLLFARFFIFTCVIVSVFLVLRTTFSSSSSCDLPFLTVPLKAIAFSPINISHILFCIAESVESWIEWSQYTSLGWRKSTRGFVWLDEQAKVLRNNGFSLPIKISGWVLDVRWFVMGDDDTVFFTDNLVKVLS
ncbi:unnamed protein product [Brassica rapa subsp. trilocularis]